MMSTTREFTRSVFLTIQEIKTTFERSRYVHELERLDAEVKATRKMNDRELAQWNAVIYRKRGHHFDTIIRKVCEKNGRNETHIRLVTGWKNGRNIITYKSYDNE